MTDSNRLEEIYHDYSGLILAYAARRLGNVDDATEVVAETFIVAWRRIDDVPAGEEARPWLYGVARRVLSNYRRSTARRLRLEDRLKLEAHIVGGERLDPTGADDDRTRAALARLSDPDRELLTLSAWDGLNSNDLAVVLGCNAVAARVRLHRARRRFAQHLAEGACNA